MALLGIDLGTSSIKAVVYDEAGHQLALSRVPTPMTELPGGWAEYPADAVWQAVCQVLSGVTSQVPPQDIVALAVTSMGEAGVPVDRAGKALYPAIAWFDPRTTPQVEWWAANVGQEKAYAITGLSLNPIFSANKILWLRENRPQVFRRMAKWLCMPDFIIHRLSGQYATDYSTASRTLLLDLASRTWSRPLLKATGLGAKLFPPLYPSGTTVGQVHRQAAADTGLRPGTLVVTGGHDHICAALAWGVVEPGVLLDSVGTAEALLTPLAAPVLSPQGMAQGFNVGCHAAQDCYYIHGGLNFSGGGVAWILQQVFGTAPQADLDSILAQVAAVPPGANGLRYIPHLRGVLGLAGVTRQAALVGLRSQHSRPELVRAVIEGLCYEARAITESLMAIAGAQVSQVQCIGGGVRNRLWMRIKAAVYGKPLVVPTGPEEEEAALGAALLAGMGARVYASQRQALAAVQLPRGIISPDQDWAERYQALYAQYRQIEPLLAQVDQTLARPVS
ncbi:MAG: carbohydrate kinase [Deinococcus sp.]|nr:carbohydrate kinase [Deinococcus sp.]